MYTTKLHGNKINLFYIPIFIDIWLVKEDKRRVLYVSIITLFWRIWRWKDLNPGFLNKFLPTVWIFREIRSIELTVLKKSQLYQMCKKLGFLKEFSADSTDYGRILKKFEYNLLVRITVLNYTVIPGQRLGCWCSSHRRITLWPSCHLQTSQKGLSWHRSWFHKVLFPTQKT